MFVYTDICYRKKVMNRYFVNPHRLASLINLLIPIRYVLQRCHDETSVIMMIIVHILWVSV